MASGDDAHRTTELEQRPYHIFSQTCEGRQGTRFMKLNIEKHSADDMRFFTRELYIQFNSTDPLEADSADELWERAIKAYKSHMRLLNRKLPDAAKRVARLCFHDAELMNPKYPVMLGLPKVGLIALAQRIGPDDWQTYLIWYVLCGELRELPAPTGWPFSGEHAQWLYDEFDVNRDNVNQFVHRIMLSDGRVIIVPFTNAGVQKMAKDAASLTKQVMQLA